MPWIAGIQRDQVNWGPGKKVFEWVEGKPKVVRHYDCVVGCTTCGNLCLGNAISFPDLQELRRLFKERGVWSAVKKALIAEGKLPAE